jgi:hypothetical protein
MAQKIPATNPKLDSIMSVEERLFILEGLVDSLSMELSALYDRIDELESNQLLT